MRLIHTSKFKVAAFVALAVLSCQGSVWAQDKTPPASPTEISDLIDGQVLPMKPARSTSEIRVLSTDLLNKKGEPTGMKILSHRTVRAAGTRSPIHAHPYGGQTCILSGEMTLYLDGGTAPQRAGAGDCYWMPPFHRMSGVNTGTTEAVMIDTFITPSENEIWVVMEPGMQGDQDQFSASHKH